MKVAISAQGNDIDSLVDPRFGRARWFIVADSETGEWQAHDNAANVDASGGAGVQAGSTVASQGAEAVITGNVGPNAHKVLAAGEHRHLPGGQRDHRARRAGRAQARRADSGRGSHRERSLGLREEWSSHERRRKAQECAGSGEEGRPVTAPGQGRGRRKDGARGSQSSLSGRTATRALVAVGTYVAQDLRDAEGLTRPMLRRAALRLALSRTRACTPTGQRVPAAGSAGAGRAAPKRWMSIEATGSSSPPRALAGGARHSGPGSGRRARRRVEVGRIPSTMSIC